MPGDDVDAPIGIRDAIAALRSELTLAEGDAAQSALRFAVDKVVLEFTVQVERAREVGGGIKFWVVNAEGNAANTTSTGHTVTIELTARRYAPDGTPLTVEIGDDDRDLPPLAP